MFFETDADQISRLGSPQLVQLMKRLVLAECRLIDIPLRSATVPLQITIPDGGEDGRVEWTGGADATDYFPARFCVFQSKAQNLTGSTIAAEVLKKQKKGPATLWQSRSFPCPIKPGEAGGRFLAPVLAMARRTS